jgi:hypothetical protein
MVKICERQCSAYPDMLICAVRSTFQNTLSRRTPQPTRQHHGHSFDSLYAVLKLRITWSYL